MHYPDFKTAYVKFNIRKKRIDKLNMVVMLTNLGTGINDDETEYINLINRFNKLPFKNKIVFSDKKIEMPNVFYLKGYDKVKKNKNIFSTQSITGKRYIDQFDYVSFINNIKK